MASKTVIAPIPGRAVALASVPDPVFSQGMVGCGAAIEPPQQVITAVAPISGTIVQLHPHAFAIAGADDFGVLVHLGIDTVNLKGEGFTVLAKVGDAVTAGQPIVKYDVPAIVAKGLNPITPVVATAEFEPANIHPGAELSAQGPIAAGAVLFTTP